MCPFADKDAQQAYSDERCFARDDCHTSRPFLGDVLVLGAGKSGQAVVRYCTQLIGTRVQSVFVAAGQDTPDVRAFLESCACDGFSYAFGDGSVPAQRQFDVCIASPGIPAWHQLYLEGKRASKRLIGELEFAWSESDPASVWIAITGTNGKTTTTALCEHLLRESGVCACAVGNIGDTCLDAVARGTAQVYVAEVSSYQLASTRDFAPDVAVILNITPDHLHWHGSFEAYRDAKLSLLEWMGAHPSVRVETGADVDSNSVKTKQLPMAVLCAVDEVVRSKVRTLRQLSVEELGYDYIPLGTSAGIGGDMRVACGARNAAFVDSDNHMIVAMGGKEYDVGLVNALQIPGAHNVVNALAAACAALAAGADAASVTHALTTFAPLEHRIEPCGEIKGVLCVNDSKATNVDSALAALEAFDGRRVIVLLGGDDKGTDLAPLIQAVYERAVAAVCFGEAASRFAAAFADAASAAPDEFILMEAAHLAEAFEAGMSVARAGDVLLLSPACASFDEFSSFEARGRAFKKLVNAYAEKLSQKPSDISGREETLSNGFTSQAKRS